MQTVVYLFVALILSWAGVINFKIAWLERKSEKKDKHILPLLYGGSCCLVVALCYLLQANIF